jgi:hypothetical protein
MLWMTLIPHGSFPSSVYGVDPRGGSRVEPVRVLREMKSDRGLPYGANQYRIKLAAGSPLSEVCGGLGVVISTGVQVQGEAIGGGAWETYSYGEIRSRLADEKGGYREATETYVGEED